MRRPARAPGLPVHDRAAVTAPTPAPRPRQWLGRAGSRPGAPRRPGGGRRGAAPARSRTPRPRHRRRHPSGGRPPPARRGCGVLAACFVVLDVVALGLLDLGDTATAVVRNLLFPGLGLFEVSTPLALAFMAVALLAVAAWTRWGTDWVVATVWAGSIVTAVVLVEPAAAEPELDEAARLLVASHEFALVMVAIAFIVRVRTWLANLPGIRRLRRRDRTGRPAGLLAVAELRSVDRARVAAIVAIAEQLGGPTGDRDVVLAALTAPSVRRRARLVGVAARWRFGGDPLRVDSAPTRAALVAVGLPHRAGGARRSGRKPTDGGPGCPPASRPGCGSWTARSPRRPLPSWATTPACSGGAAPGRSSSGSGTATGPRASTRRWPWAGRGRPRGSTPRRRPSAMSSAGVGRRTGPRCASERSAPRHVARRGPRTSG